MSFGRWAASIGLEIHLQLATVKKLFSPAKVNPLAQPNTCVAYFDVSLPGSMPILNPEALKFAVKGALALNCEVANVCKFDRKHYFYPDLPAGYQITQKEIPIGRNGFIPLSAGLDNVPDTQIPIQHIQLEQDTAKSTSAKNPSRILLDYNRAGTPLLEIVTKPCFHDVNTVSAFLFKLQSIVRFAGISEALMENGGMRCDVNVSIAPVISSENLNELHFKNNGVISVEKFISHFPQLGTQLARVELKNLSNVRNVVNSIRHEVDRQVSLANMGVSWPSETRGFNDITGKTFPLRNKTTSDDYLFLPETDIPPIILSRSYVNSVLKSLPALPDELFQKLTTGSHAISHKEARTLLSVKEYYHYYRNAYHHIDSISHLNQSLKEDALRTLPYWITVELVGKVREIDPSPNINIVPPLQLADIVLLVSKKKLTAASAKLFLRSLIKSPSSKPISTLIQEKNFGTIGDSEKIKACVESVLSKHSKQFEELKNGKTSLIKWFVGLTMRELRGQASPKDIEMEVQSSLRREK